jgi:hypothetical protein
MSPERHHQFPVLLGNFSVLEWIPALTPNFKKAVPVQPSYKSPKSQKTNGVLPQLKATQPDYVMLRLQGCPPFCFVSLLFEPSFLNPATLNYGGHTHHILSDLCNGIYVSHCKVTFEGMVCEVDYCFDISTPNLG